MRRFSIRTLMAVVVVSAAGLAALTNANEMWAGIMLLRRRDCRLPCFDWGGDVAGQRTRLVYRIRVPRRRHLACAFSPWLSDRFQGIPGTTQILRELFARISARTRQAAIQRRG